MTAQPVSVGNVYRCTRRRFLGSLACFAGLAVGLSIGTNNVNARATDNQDTDDEVSERPEATPVSQPLGTNPGQTRLQNMLNSLRKKVILFGDGVTPKHLSLVDRFFEGVADVTKHFLAGATNQCLNNWGIYLGGAALLFKRSYMPFLYALGFGTAAQVGLSLYGSELYLVKGPLEAWVPNWMMTIVTSGCVGWIAKTLRERAHRERTLPSEVASSK